MKKNLKILIAVFLLAGMVFPGGSIFKNISAKTALSDAQPSLPLVQISAASPLGYVSVNSAAGLLLGYCEAQAGKSLGLVQDAGVINLNQSGNCFKLSPSVITPKAGPITVQPLVQVPVKIAVVNSGPFLSAEDFVSGTPNPFSLPVLPVMPAIAVSAAFITLEKIRQKKSLTFKHLFLQDNLGRLEVLRC